MKFKKYFQFLLPLSYISLILIASEFLIRFFEVPEFYLPLPSKVFQTAIKNIEIILFHLGVTLTEALIGFLLGNFFGIIFGFLFSQLKFVRQAFYPIVVGLQTVPIVAIAPFIIIWFGPGLIGKVIMAALICYFPATVISTNGFSHVNKDALALLKSIGASKMRIFTNLRFPSAVPAIISALQVSSTLCAIGAIVAELAGSDKGVGYLIIRASYEYRTPMLFATLIITSIATFLFFKIIQSVGGIYAIRYKFGYSTNEK